MSSEETGPAQRLTDALRLASAQGIVVSQAVAAKVGLHTTDLECLDIIQMQTAVSAGEIARKTGLTTGAVTALLDRLERAGYIKRQPDPGDRRRVLVAVQADRLQSLWAIYRPLQAAMETHYASYSETDLLTIAEFMERAATISADFVRTLTSDESGPRKPSGSPS